MRLAIMQPYFMPYIGYFSLIYHCDEFILLDTVQYIYHGWIERNRILKPDEGCQYISVPLKKHSNRDSIQSLYVDNANNWEKKIIQQLQHYKKKAKYYYEVLSLLERVFSCTYHTITMLNKACLEEVCAYIGLSKKMTVFSEMDLKIERATQPDEWALNICKAVPGVTEYVNSPGGQAFFDPKKYNDVGISLAFVNNELIPYRQKGGEFIPALSIIDVLMFNSPEEIMEMLHKSSIIYAQV